MLLNALNKNVSNPVVYDFVAQDNPSDSKFPAPINLVQKILYQLIDRAGTQVCSGSFATGLDQAARPAMSAVRRSPPKW
jgi:hypothetical protein